MTRDDEELTDEGGLSRRLFVTSAAGLVASSLLVPWGGGLALASAPTGLLVPGVTRPGKGQLALTFDDGPHSTTTDKVLKILAKRGVPATFFVVGTNVDRLPAVTRRIARAGHRVQIHSWNHRRLTTLSTSQIQADLKRASRVIATATGRTPNAFRPPYGATNSRVKQAAAAIGLRQVMWNACPDVGVTSASVMLKQTLRYAAIAKRNGVGATVLLHDGSGPRGAMLEMLSPLISELRDRGWSFVRYT